MTSRSDIWHERAKLKSAIRNFFGQRDYLEVDTPIAVLVPGTEVHLRYFKTEWHDVRGCPHPLYLRSSPELHMKRVLTQGVPKIFQLAPSFRNHGEVSDWHHPEFTMLEWYEAGISFNDFMMQTESLLRETHVAMGSALLMPKTFTKISVTEAFKEWAGIDLIDQDPNLGELGCLKGIFSVNRTDDFETAFFKILLDSIEPKLKELKGAILYDYPPSQAALSVVRDGVAKRFEFYIHGIELCNAFEELLDPRQNLKRFEESNKQRAAHGYEVPGVDHEFLSNLSRGLPQCSGNALGFDRWLAMLLGETQIRRIIPFAREKPWLV